MLRKYDVATIQGSTLDMKDVIESDFLNPFRPGNGEKNSSATLALLLKCSHSATLALLLGAALLSQLPFRGLYRMFIVPLALLIAHNGTAPKCS